MRYTSNAIAINQDCVQIGLEEACRSAGRAWQGGIEIIVVECTGSGMCVCAQGICDAPRCAVRVAIRDFGKPEPEPIALIEGNDSVPAQSARS